MILMNDKDMTLVHTVVFYKSCVLTGASNWLSQLALIKFNLF